MCATGSASVFYLEVGYFDSHWRSQWHTEIHM